MRVSFYCIPHTAGHNHSHDSHGHSHAHDEMALGNDDDGEHEHEEGGDGHAGHSHQPLLSQQMSMLKQAGQLFGQAMNPTGVADDTNE